MDIVKVIFINFIGFFFFVNNIEVNKSIWSEIDWIFFYVGSVGRFINICLGFFTDILWFNVLNFIFLIDFFEFFIGMGEDNIFIDGILRGWRLMRRGFGIV